LDNLPTTKTPLSYLKEQADELSLASNRLLIGEVDPVGTEGSKFAYDLDIIAPRLNSYRYTAVRITHDIELYPVTVVSSAIKSPKACMDEADFLATLETILTSPKIRKILSSLISQSS
jgi:hypothetical protein